MNRKSRRRRLLWLLMSVSVLGLVFTRPRLTPLEEALRAMYVTKLLAYHDVPYQWGGEGEKGIDCSGLARRALIDANLNLAFKRLDVSLLVTAFQLWFFDFKAADLKTKNFEFTEILEQVSDLSAFNHTQIKPGDMAVTNQGKHVLVYLGYQTWIEASSTYGKVVLVTAPEFFPRHKLKSAYLVRWTQLRG